MNALLTEILTFLSLNFMAKEGEEANLRRSFSSER